MLLSDEGIFLVKITALVGTIGGVVVTVKKLKRSLSLSLYLYFSINIFSNPGLLFFGIILICPSLSHSVYCYSTHACQMSLMPSWQIRCLHTLRARARVCHYRVVIPCTAAPLSYNKLDVVNARFKSSRVCMYLCLLMFGLYYS